MPRVNLVGLLPSELEDLAAELGAPRYRGRQLATWLYRKATLDLDAMTDLPRDFRAALAERATVELPALERVTSSQDGSRKLVFRVPGAERGAPGVVRDAPGAERGVPCAAGEGRDALISAVLMPDDDRLTLCLSTQAGCGFECAFCLTGTMGLERNLTTAEIVGQLLVASALAGPEQRVTHLVFMGMGEPLANYAALVGALRIFTDARLGLGYSPRRITVSTVGLVPGIERLGRENLRVNLAISLHAASDEVRGRLMPVNRSFDLAALMAAVRAYPLAPRQRVFFEYVLLDGVNDAPEEARRLVHLLRGVRAKVNLIPFNDWPGAGFERPPLARILAFQSILLEAGVTTTVRWSKGEDIGAACGQLREPVPA
jgi:23S rRNA (adenine2503-C2)-methyltransferase